MSEIEQIKSILEFHICTEAYPVVSAMVDSMAENGYSTGDMLQIVNGMLRKIGNKSSSQSTNSRTVMVQNGVINIHPDPKDIPMKVANNYTWSNHDQRPDGDCPACGRSLSGNAHTPKVKRCPDCNQLLDWDS